MTITTDLHGSTASAFSRRPSTSKVEALVTLGAGAALAIYAMVRRTWSSVPLGAGGGYLLYCGVSQLRSPYQGRVRKAQTIAKTPQELYEFVRRPDNWNRFLHAIRLHQEGHGRFRLELGEPAGMDLSSHIQITDEKPSDYIAWAADDEKFEHRGVIRFRNAPGNRGTDVSVALEYKAPGGPIARSLAALVGWEPEQVARESLRHLKQLTEAGEIPTTAGQPVGRRGMKGAALRVLYREGPTEDATEPARLAGD
jgi:uncharacterized membrane protein